MNKSLFVLFFLFLSICLNQESYAVKVKKAEDAEKNTSVGILKIRQKVPDAPKKRSSTSKLQSSQTQPEDRSIVHGLARTRYMQHIFWKCAIEIEEEAHNSNLQEKKRVKVILALRNYY